jgi:hypothetical protein
MTRSLAENVDVVDLGAAWINNANQSEIYSLAQDINFVLVQQRAQGYSLTRNQDGQIDQIPHGAETKVRAYRTSRQIYNNFSI